MLSTTARCADPAPTAGSTRAALGARFKVCAVKALSVVAVTNGAAENSPYLPPSVLEPGASMPMPIPGSSDAVAQTAQYLSSSSGHQSSNAVLHPDLRDFSDVELPASIGGVVSQAWHQGMGSDKLERHKARIADASKELAMRIREYNEWLETPAGRLALQQDQEREQALAQQEHDSWGSQNPETSFETSLESNMS